MAKFSNGSGTVAASFGGEAAIDLTVDVFPAGGSCVNIANVLPGTVTGNSDSADYKDTVLADFPDISNCGTVTVVKETDPAGGGGNFSYTLARADGSRLRFLEHGGQTQLTETLTADGDSDTHLKLTAGNDYSLAEDDAGAEWELLSIECAAGQAFHDVTAGGTFPVESGSEAVCTITNKYVKASPAGTSLQTVILHDSIRITGIRAGAPNPAANVKFHLHADAACSSELQGSPITIPLDYKGDGRIAEANTFSSPGISVGVAGTYFWKIEYPGDSFNNGFTTAGGDETTSVTLHQ